MKKILVVEDHDPLRHGIVEAFQRSGHLVAEAGDAETAIRLISEEYFGVVVTDISLPRHSGIEVLKAAKQTNPLTTVIVMTAYGTVENAVEAMRVGADDYLQKPFPIEELELKVSKALEHQTALQTIEDLRQTTGWPHQLLGQSPQLRHLLGVIQKIGKSQATILIEGETGTGKELVAKAIHAASPRADRALIKVNCAALPEPLLESELFGHEKGAFTGADRQRIGRFELANSGTLFLDEIAEISLTTQAKLLRAIQERAFERVGGEKTITIDVRIIAATNKDLQTEVKAHRFRDDLFYRLNVVTVTLPALRERKEDIPLLAEHFAQYYAKELGKRIQPLAPSVLNALQDYPWPGNIRELENTMERAVLMAEGDTIKAKDISCAGPEPARSENDFTLPPGGMSLENIEKQAILAALDRTGWVQKDAATLLGVSARVLNYKIKGHHITHPTWLRHRPPQTAA